MTAVVQVGEVAQCVGPQLYPIARLLDDLRHDELSERVKAVRSLDKIASALGPERTIGELIPFLSELLDDEDEVLEAIAEQFGSNAFLGLNCPHVLLPSLETLARMESVALREAACTSIRAIIECLSSAQAESLILPLVSRLAGQDWFTGQCSACNLCSLALARMPPERKEDVFRQFSKIATDENVIVRRHAASNLGAVAAYTPEARLPDALNLLTKVSRDDQMSVRCCAPAAAVELAQVFQGQAWVTHVLPAVQTCAEDSSARVRIAVLAEFPHLIEILQGAGLAGSVLLPLFLRFLADPEADVRVQSCAHAKALLAAEPAAGAVSLYEPLKKLSRDQSDEVRVALAEVVLTLAPLLGPQRTAEHLLNIALQLLRDEYPMVRLALLSTLPEIASVISVELLVQSLEPAAVGLTSERAWRVRVAVLSHAPTLAAHLGEATFMQTIAPPVLALIEDRVASVRIAAAETYAALARVFGDAWVLTHIVPILQRLQHARVAGVRVAVCQSIAALAAVVDPRTTTEALTPVLFALCQDPVPNVRLNAAKIIPQFSAYRDVASSMANQLVVDPDRDVAFFASAAVR
jgi:serine/threonine-protein phosphatase 2A regulatory subunit A